MDELAKSEAHFRFLAQNASEMTAILSAEGAIRYVSPSVEKILGCKAEKIVGKNAFRYVHPAEIAATQREFAKCIKQPSSVVFSQFRVLHVDGSWLDVEAAANNLLEDANTQGVVISCRSITERKRAEETLNQYARKEQLMGAITNRIRQYWNLEEVLKITVAEVREFLKVDRILIHRFEPDWSSVITVESVAASWNSMLGMKINNSRLTANDIKLYQQGHIKIINDIPPANGNQVSHELRNAFQVKANLEFPLLIHSPDSAVFSPNSSSDHSPALTTQNSKLWGLLIAHQCSEPRQWQQWEIDWLNVLATHLAIAIQQAQLYHQVSTLNIDIEHQVQERIQELQQKVKELEQLNVLKDDFLSTVSHELRTPLSNMKMAIQMLKVVPTGERRQLYLEILQNECGRETDLINDLLDLQRLEADAYPVFRETVNLQEWLHSIIEPFRSRTQQHQQILEIDLPPDLPAILLDCSSTGRIFAELLNNACKYTPAGARINLWVRYDASATNQLSETFPILTFTLRNQSEIPLAELPRIFQKFYRVPNADPGKRGGTGLGLALVKKLVDQLEGNLEVESKDGWTTFTVQFKIQP